MEKYFLGLDFPVASIIPIGVNAIKFLEKEFGEDFVKKKVGVKINAYALKGQSRYQPFWNYSIFTDEKIFHGANTGYKIIDELGIITQVNYITVSTHLGRKILTEYVQKAKGDNIKVIGFTVHTKISENEVIEIHKQNVEGTIYTLGKIAMDSGCDAIVLEVRMLDSKKIRELPIKKLVTGIRIDPSDKGSQSRITTLDELEEKKDLVDYIVISRRYVDDFGKLKMFIDKLE